MKHKIEDFLSPFVAATETTLLDLCKSKVHATRILTKTTLPKDSARFAAVIGITSPTIQGSMSVHFPEAVFLSLMNRMLGESMTQIEPGLEDGAAEITNIIFGNAKTKLNELDFQIQMALPTLLREKESRTSDPAPPRTCSGWSSASIRDPSGSSLNWAPAPQPM